MLRQLCSLLFFFFLANSWASAQSWKLYDTNDGLPSNKLTDVCSTGPNQIWIASDSGLIFFDGQSFLRYSTFNSNLASNNIFELEVVAGQVWMITSAGLSRFNGRTFVNYDQQSGLLSNVINGIAVDTNDQLWIAANAGVSKFDGLAFTHDTGRVARDIIVDDSNRVYILKYTAVFNIPSAGLTVYEVFDGQSWSSPPMSSFSEIYRGKFIKSPSGKIFFTPSGAGNQYFAELKYPFNLTKRPIITESTIARTPRYVNEFNNENWMNYWGAASIYKGAAKDSVFQPLYLLPRSSSISDMIVDQQNVYIATDRGLLLGPTQFNTPSFKKELDINEIKAGIHIKGALFHNYEDQSPAFEFPKDSNTHMINFASFQLGIKKDSNLGTFQVFPEELNRQNFLPGPYHNSPIIVGDEYAVKINKTDIDQHRINYNQPNYNTPASILNWPAKADSLLSAYPDLAPFHDANNNGCYEPGQGDYPLIKGDQAIYWINHPEDKSLALEYHWMIYGYNSTDTALDRTVFAEVRIINRDTITYEYLKAGIWVDGDVGSPNDDFNGADSARSLLYFYNGDSFDGNLVNRKGYLTNPPALGIRALSSAAESIIFYQTAIENTPFLDSWCFLHGLNGDSSRLRNPFTSRFSRYQFDGDPVSVTGWSELNTNPTISRRNQAGQRRGVMGLDSFSLAPGESHRVELAFNIAQGTSRFGTADYIPMLRNQVDRVDNFYRNLAVIPTNYAQYFNCPVLVQLDELEEEKERILYPNPSKGEVFISHEEPILRIEVRSISGQLIRAIEKRNSFDLSDLQAGYYLIRWLEGSSWQQQKLVLLD